MSRGEDAGARFSSHKPHSHIAVWLAWVITKPIDIAYSSGIDEYVF